MAAVWAALGLMLAAPAALHGDEARPTAVPADPHDGPAGDLAWTEHAWPDDGLLHCPQACLLHVPPASQGTVWAWWNGSAVPGFALLVDGVPGVAAVDAVRGGRVAGGEEVRLVGQGAVGVAVLPDVPGVPDLVALVPANVGSPLGPERGHGPERGRTGCLLAEAGGRCLRLTTGLANVGDTALRLASGVAGDAAMLQALPDGDRAAGTAVYHDLHAHFHYSRLMEFDLHAFDLASGLRGAVAASSGKSGFCLVDFGPVQGMHPPGKAYWRRDCAPMAVQDERLTMGVSPGWYDIYRWYLPEQALDLGGVPDGVYELVVTLDPDGTLVENHALDNRASVVLRWEAGQATVLRERGLYRLDPQPS